MEENYLISILGRQVVNGEPEEIEVTTFGQYSEKNGKRYIMYREYEDSVPSSKARTSILKVAEGRVTLLRAGMRRGWCWSTADGICAAMIQASAR